MQVGMRERSRVELYFRELYVGIVYVRLLDRTGDESKVMPRDCCGVDCK